MKNKKQWSAQTGAGLSIGGTAEFLREAYEVLDQKFVIVRCPVTGARDISEPVTEETRIQKRLDKAHTIQEKKQIARSERARRRARLERERRKKKSLRDKRN